MGRTLRVSRLVGRGVPPSRGSPGTARPTLSGSPGTARPTLRSRGTRDPTDAVARERAPPSTPPGWRRSQLSPAYPFAEEWVLKKVFAVEFVDYLVGYEALECLGDTADIPYPVGLHELAGKHLGMVGLGNPL